MAEIRDGQSRDVVFANDLSGQVIDRNVRTRVNTASSWISALVAPLNTGYSDQAAPRDISYGFGGKSMGKTGNNGTVNTDYTSSYGAREYQAQTSGIFKNGSASGAANADFDQSYQALNSFNQGSTAGTYTVRGGDTLQAIAASLYGDSGLAPLPWPSGYIQSTGLNILLRKTTYEGYKIAQANGISANTALIQGQTLRLPSGVTRSTNNANTFQPYNPGEALGDIAPTAPEPPKDNKCGVMGQILLVVIAVAVTVITSGAAAGAFGLVGGGVSGGIGAATSIAGGGLVGAVAGAGVTLGSAAGLVAVSAARCCGWFYCLARGWRCHGHTGQI